MPLVNLIKEDRLAAAAKERQVRMFVLGCIAIGGLSFMSAGYFTLEAKKSKDRIATLQKALDEAQPYIEQVERNQSEIAKLEPRIQTLTSAQEATLKWSRILDHLKFNMPDGVWLTGLQCMRQSADDPISVSLKGMSTTQEAVGYFILRVESSKDLEGTSLVFTQERRTEKGKALEFEITGKLEGTKVETKKTKEVDPV